MGPCGRAWGAGAFGWVVTMAEETAGDFRCDGDLLCNGVFGHVVDVLVCLCLARPICLFQPVPSPLLAYVASSSLTLWLVDGKQNADPKSSETESFNQYTPR